MSDIQEPKESAKAYAAFLEYCALGPGRSLRKLAEKWGKNASYVGQLERWSSQYGWQERVKLQDAELAEEKRRQRDEEIERMNARHAAIGMEQQERAVQQINALIEAKAFGSMAAVQLLKLAADLERLARGAPTERSEQTGPDGEPLQSGAQVIFYLPQVEPEEGYSG